MKKTLITGLSTLLFAVFFTTAAFARELMVGGEAVGIQIHTKGVLVAELAEVETMDGPVSPAKEAGLQKGDLITAIDGEAVGSAVALVEAVGQRDGEPVALTPTEYEILKLLMEHPGQVFSPKEIYKKIWNDLPYGSENTVAVHIRHLREKLEINPAEPRYLKVVWGQGYKMEKG